MRRPVLLICLLVALIVFLVAACGGNEEPVSECTRSSDCQQEICKTASCSAGRCSYATKQNCCGNRQQESMEDGKPGNACTCPKDYGNCSGAVKTTVKGKEKAAQYVTNYCDGQLQCVQGINPDVVLPIALTQQLRGTLFTLDLIVEYPNPMIMNKDKVTFKITLREIKDDLDFPIVLKKIQLVNNQRLFGQLTTGQGFNSRGQTIEVQVPLTGELGILESKLALTYKIDEEHGKRVKGARRPDGSYEYTTVSELATLTGNLGSDLVVVDLS